MGLNSELANEFAETGETRPVENALTEKIIGAAIEVHRHLGPGLLESIYEECLCYELSQLGLQFQRQVYLPITYKGLKLESAYKMDLVVGDAIVIEIKATEQVSPVHHSQLLTYLKCANKSLGLLINFNVPILKNGLKRVVNNYSGPSPEQSQSASPRLPPRLRASASDFVPAPLTKEPQ
jgi:GxxExxY protein